jgi:hypothetical protein
MRPPLANGTILITGASSGIGEALARQLAISAKALVLVARRADRLERLAAALRASRPSLEVHVVACDLTDREATAAMADGVLERMDVDVLVNNAGFGDSGMFEQTDWATNERMLELNVRALTYLTHRFVEPMVRRRRGGVLNVSSGFGLQTMPGFAAYVGTKHYVTGFTESLRAEVASAGVVVTQICPGPVETEFAEVAGLDALPSSVSIVQISAEQCARAAIRGFSRGRALIVPGFVIRVVLALGAITPRVVLRWMNRPIGAYLRRLQA